MNKFDLTGFRSITLPSEPELTAKWKISTSTPKVSFVCMAFNHENFIEDTIRGFLLQETDFPFEIIIHEDASSDNTAKTLHRYSKLYPNVITCIIQTENQYGRDRHYPLRILLDLAKGEYIAICEGDDFWICRNKISNQVDIHEKKLDIALTYSKAHIYIESKKESLSTVGNAMTNQTIYSRNGIPTLTVMFKKKLLSGFYDYVECSQHEWLHSDYQLWLWLNLKGNIYFEDKVTALYRVLDSSASRPVDIQAQYNYRLSVLSTSVFFAIKNLSSVDYNWICFKSNMFVYFWCLKRKLPQAEIHKVGALKCIGKPAKFFMKIVLNVLVEKIIMPIYIKVK